jgi:hypothetical protein
MSVTTQSYAGDNLDRDIESGPLSDEEYESDESHAKTGSDTNWNQERRTGFNPYDDKINKNPTVVRYGKKYARWNWLNQLDNGVRDPHWEEIRRHRFQQKKIEILCCQLQCPSFHERRVKHIFGKVDGDSYSGNYHYEEVIMAIISLVSDEDIEIVSNQIRSREKWDELLDDLDTERGGGAEWFS